MVGDILVLRLRSQSILPGMVSASLPDGSGTCRVDAADLEAILVWSTFVTDKRITPEEIVRAYVYCGLGKTTGTYFRWDHYDGEAGKGALRCACPLAAKYLDENKITVGPIMTDVSHEVLTWAHKVYGVSYVGGFIDGVDHDTCSPGALDSERYQLGHEDGTKVRIDLGLD